MNGVRHSRNVLLTFAGCALAPTAAHALCSEIAEGGRWQNVRPGDSPAFIDAGLIDCGDNPGSVTKFAIRVWPTNFSYARPRVSATFRQSAGHRWLVGRVSTGGYQDIMWLRREPTGERRLIVFIHHDSLDSKPDAKSWHYYRNIGRANWR